MVLDTIRFRPLFYDALSEPFAPKTDPEKRNHTLGRLGIATITKGENYRIPNHPAYLTRYEPSWGGGALSVAYSVESQDYSTRTTQLLHLMGHGEHVAVVDSVYNDRIEGDLLLWQDDEILGQYELELGEKLSVARAAVSELVGRFFEKQADSAH
jgi:hypothetical protein